MTPTPNAPDAALLPCPFCGGAAIRRPGRLSIHIGCSNMDCRVSQSQYFYDTEAEATAAWNRRAGQSHADAALLAALEGLLLNAEQQQFRYSVSSPYVRALEAARAAIAAAKGA